VPGSRSADNSMLSYNGIGGVFGVGAMLGPKDPRPAIPLKAIVKPGEGDTIHWHSKEVLDTERVLQAGTSFTDKPRSGEASPSGFNGNHDVAQAILRHSDPDFDIKADRFLNYNPAEPPAKDDPTLYVHTWAAYTPEGSKRREEAARGQLAYEEWRKTHPKQVLCPSCDTSVLLLPWSSARNFVCSSAAFLSLLLCVQGDAAEHGVGCFHGKLPCKDDTHDIFITPGEGSEEGAGGGGNGEGGEGGGGEEVETK